MSAGPTLCTATRVEQAREGHVRITLSFTKVRCDRCGDPERIYGVSCATCGRKPGPSEVNYPVWRRQAIVASARPRLQTATVAGSMPGDFESLPSEILDGLAACPNAIIRAVVAVCDERKNAEKELGHVLESVANLRSRARGLPTLRPHVSRRRMLVDVADQLMQYAAHLLDALSAETLLSAQDAAARAQEHLDRITDYLANVNRVLGAALKIADVEDTADLMLTILREVKVLYDAESIVALDALGKAEARATLGGGSDAADLRLHVPRPEGHRRYPYGLSQLARVPEGCPSS